MDSETFDGRKSSLVKKWEPVLEGITNSYKRRVTAVLLENQAKHILAERMKLTEDLSVAATTVGKLGTFQKFAFPLVRRVYPELIANNLVEVQPMQGPVSQIFYLGHTRQSGSARAETIFSKHRLTYGGKTTSGVFGGGNLDLDSPPGNAAGYNPFLSSLFGSGFGAASTTYGGQIAAWPNPQTILGYHISSGEFLTGTGIPEINFHIEQQPVVSQTRKMRALWTIEANQDLKAYHGLDLERELTQLMGQELQLEIDREVVEDIRNLAYDPNTAAIGGFFRDRLDNPNSNNFGAVGGVGQAGTTFVPANFLYDFGTAPLPPSIAGTQSNVFVIDFSSSALPFAPRHVGEVWANLLAIINLASQDIYKTTHRGPGTWMLTSPLIASLLESAAKLEGGIAREDNQTNIAGSQISYKGKFAGRYDMFVDPLYPEDEILVGYKGRGPMDAGYVYCPYIPLELLPTIPDPENFQPRKGVLTRYGKASVTPSSRFYRIIRIVGPTANYLFTPFGKSQGNTPGGNSPTF